MITARGGNLEYITELANGITNIYADVTKEKGGQGMHFRPHDLLEASVAACMNIIARMSLDSMHVKYDSVQVKIVLDRSVEGKPVFKYSLELSGEGIDESVRERVLRAVTFCPVKKTLSSQISFELCSDI